MFVRRRLWTSVLGIYLVVLGLQPLLKLSIPGGSMALDLLALLAGALVLMDR